MKVNTIIGAHAYAVIEENGRRTDIRLAPGKSAAASLREYAADQRKQAEDKREMADLAERAALMLTTPQYLSAGEKLWDGTTVTHFLAASYNRLTDMIEGMRAHGRRVPETLLDARHKLIASAGEHPNT